MFKSILLVDTTGATNLVGTQYETGNTPIATNGTLVSRITAVQQVELINLLNPTQLACVRMNITRLPVLEKGSPHDFFLFVGNDNDFQGTNICFYAAAIELLMGFYAQAAGVWLGDARVNIGVGFAF